MKFTKPAIDIDAQIALLKQRGLEVAAVDVARHYLRFVGYYRLAGYALPLQVNYNEDGSHRFLAGTTFDDVLDLYVFDRKLRLAVMDAVERIEVAVRALLSQTMSELHGPHWFMEAAHFVPSFRHSQFISRVKDDIGHDSARAGMRQNQKPIAKAFGLDGTVLGSWLHALSYVRNLAAHHQRLWNRAYTIKPIAARHLAADLQDTTRFYAQAVMIEALLRVVAPGSLWGERLADLLAQHPKVRLDRLGFPEGWQQRAVWTG